MGKERSGAVMDIEIHRASGDVIKFEKVHNILGNAAAASIDRTTFGTTNGTAYTHSVPMLTAVEGTFSQSGNVITQATGPSNILDSFLNGEVFVFGDGTGGYSRKDITLSTSTCQTYESRTVATTTMSAYRTSNLDNISGLQQQVNVNVTRTYLSSGPSGALRWTFNNPIMFARIQTPYTIRRIIVGAWSGIFGTYYTHFDLPSAVNLAWGDAVYISNYTLNYNAAVSARSYDVSPLSGTGFTSSSARSQRLLRISQRNTAGLNPCDRIWLLSEANKINIPVMLGPTDGFWVPVTSFTPTQTLTAVGFDNFTQTNNLSGAIQTVGCSALVLSSGQFRQIIFGNSAQAYGIYEFGVPTNLSAGRLINIMGHTLLRQ